MAPAEAIVVEEAQKFQKAWAQRRNAPVIGSLTRELEAKRMEVVRQLFARLNGRLSERDQQEIEGAFRLFQNRILHGPISALTEESHTPPAGGGHTLLDALRKLFRLQD